MQKPLVTLLFPMLYAHGDDTLGAKKSPSRKPLEHKTDSWSLVNFLSMVGSALTLFPILSIVKKYSMFSYSKKVKNEVENDFTTIEHYLSDNEKTDNLQETLTKAIKKFRNKIRVGFVIEALMLAGSIITFLFTQDLTMKVAFVDRYTPFMIALFAISLIADIACFTYRGQELPEVINAIITGQLERETIYNS